MVGRTVVGLPGPNSLRPIVGPTDPVDQITNIGCRGLVAGAHAAGWLNATCVPAFDGFSVVALKELLDRRALATQAGAPVVSRLLRRCTRCDLACVVRFASR